MFCSLTNEKVSDALETDVNFICFTASYEIQRRKEEEKAMKKLSQK